MKSLHLRKKIEPHSTFSTDASLPYIVYILFHARKPSKMPRPLTYVNKRDSGNPPLRA